MCVQTIVTPKGMSEIKVAKWRYFLMFFVLLTSGCVVIDCLDKSGMPFRDALELILKDALFPAIIVAVIFLFSSAREG
jgi:hypothetical protein